MNLLVTGAAGFIGSNFVHWLFKNKPGEHNIIAYDALTYAGNLDNLHGVIEEDNFSFVKADICDANSVEKTIEEFNIDCIINFAAETHVDRSIVSAIEFVKTNVEGTQILLNAGLKLGIKKYIQISTDEVYGSLGPEGSFSETTPLDPSSPYSASKTGADLLALAMHRTHGMNVCVTRCSNNYGPYQFPEKLLPLFITNANSDQQLPLYGDGKNVRSWLHVDDHSSAICRVLEDGKPGEIYNIGGKDVDEKTNIEVTDLILNILDKPKSLIKYVEDRKGHDRRYAVDYTKIKNELGWEPTVRFEDGLRQTINWYLDNKEWWQKIKSGEYMKFYDLYYSNKL